MKPDVLTITAIVFIFGVLVSSMGLTEGTSPKRDVPPPALHQGVVVSE